jgi:hypothetical protein
LVLPSWIERGTSACAEAIAATESIAAIATPPRAVTVEVYGIALPTLSRIERRRASIDWTPPRA